MKEYTQENSGLAQPQDLLSLNKAETGATPDILLALDNPSANSVKNMPTILQKRGSYESDRWTERYELSPTDVYSLKTSECGSAISLQRANSNNGSPSEGSDRSRRNSQSPEPDCEKTLSPQQIERETALRAWVQQAIEWTGKFTTRKNRSALASLSDNGAEEGTRRPSLSVPNTCPKVSITRSLSGGAPVVPHNSLSNRPLPSHDLSVTPGYLSPSLGHRSAHPEQAPLNDRPKPESVQATAATKESVSEGVKTLSSSNASNQMPVSESVTLVSATVASDKLDTHSDPDSNRIATILVTNPNTQCEDGMPIATIGLSSMAVCVSERIDSDENIKVSKQETGDCKETAVGEDQTASIAIMNPNTQREDRTPVTVADLDQGSDREVEQSLENGKKVTLTADITIGEKASDDEVKKNSDNDKMATDILAEKPPRDCREPTAVKKPHEDRKMGDLTIGKPDKPKGQDSLQPLSSPPRSLIQQFNPNVDKEKDTKVIWEGNPFNETSREKTQRAPRPESILLANDIINSIISQIEPSSEGIAESIVPVIAPKKSDSFNERELIASIQSLATSSPTVRTPKFPIGTPNHPREDRDWIIVNQQSQPPQPIRHSVKFDAESPKRHRRRKNEEDEPEPDTHFLFPLSPSAVSETISSSITRELRNPIMKLFGSKKQYTKDDVSQVGMANR